MNLNSKKVIELIEQKYEFSGDLYNEEEILNWLMTQKDPSGDVIEELEGEQLLHAIHNSESLAVFFCKLRIISIFFLIHQSKILIHRLCFVWSSQMPRTDL